MLLKEKLKFKSRFSVSIFSIFTHNISTKITIEKIKLQKGSKHVQPRAQLSLLCLHLTTPAHFFMNYILMVS